MRNRAFKSIYLLLLIVLIITFTAGFLAFLIGCGTAATEPNIYLDENIQIAPDPFIIGQSDQGVGINILFSNTSEVTGFIEVNVLVDGTALEPDRPADVPEYTGLPLMLEVSHAGRSVQYFYPVNSTTRLGVHEVKIGNITRTFTVKESPQINVTTTGVNQIFANSANLLGFVAVPSGSGSVSVGFEYGLDTEYGSNVPGVPPTVSMNYNFTAKITGLEPMKTYHFRAKATIGNVTVYGEDKSVQTTGQ